MTNDVLRALAEARPAHLEPEAGVPDEIRAAETARAMAGRRETRRRSFRRRVARVGGGPGRSRRGDRAGRGLLRYDAARTGPADEARRAVGRAGVPVHGRLSGEVARR